MPDVALGETPIRHADCCLGISTTLLECIDSVTLQDPSRPPGLVLSVGSGSGLFESLILERWTSQGKPGWTIEGVEVQQSGLSLATIASTSANKYLPEPNYSTVKGTWDLSTRARVASVFMFVYPRSPCLVTQYCQAFSLGRDTQLHTLLWLGPKCDWADFEGCFATLDGWSVCVVDDSRSGLFDYEMLAVIQTTN
jgi:hypothetical protein